VDFTLFFRRLGDLRIGNVADDEPVRDLFLDRPAFDAWAVQYRARLRAEDSDDDARRLAMHAVNPKYVLRNYLAQDAIDRRKRRISVKWRACRSCNTPLTSSPNSSATPHCRRTGPAISR
jgi:uncharacterized protein YdiU (UPF0061 family)